jgi:hypothetical protein
MASASTSLLHCIQHGPMRIRYIAALSMMAIALGQLGFGYW